MKGEYRRTKSAQQQSDPDVPRCNFYSQLDAVLGGGPCERIEDELAIDKMKIEIETPRVFTALNEVRLENLEDPLLTSASQAGSTSAFPEPSTPDSSSLSGDSAEKSRKRTWSHSTVVDFSEILESFRNTIVQVTNAHFEAMAAECEKQREWERRENEAARKANADLVHGVVAAVMKGFAKSRRGGKRKRGEVIERSDESDSD